MSSQAMCTCKTRDPTIAAKFHKTEADKDGICIACGHYVMWESDYNLFPKSYKGIHGYKVVSHHHTPGWGTAEIDNHRSYIESDHINFEVISGNLQLDYSGIGKGSRKKRAALTKGKGRSKSNINQTFNRRQKL